MKERWAAALIFVVAACGSAIDKPAGQASTSNSPISASASPPAAAISPAASPSSTPTNAAGTLPLITVDFTCVLPVFGLAGMHTGAFISFPDRKLTTATESGYYYDRAVARWVPVRRQAVSPDGRRYAYTEGWSASPPTAPHLHVTDAATNIDVTVVTMPDAQPYQVVDFTNAAIYLVMSFEGTAPGVWRFDPATGALSKTSDGYYPPAGPAWIGVVDPRDPNPHRSTFSGEPVPDRIDRRDDSGASTTWFYAPGFSVSWVAFTGSPTLLVSAFKQDDPVGPYQELYWLVDAPAHATPVTFKASDPLDLAAGFGGEIADDHGIWMGGTSSLYLVRRDGTVLRVFDGSAKPANSCA